MKRKIYFLFCILAFVIMFCFDVSAAGVSYFLSNSELKYFYYDKNSNKVTTVNKGDYVIVDAIIDGDGVNYALKSGKLTLRWDDSAFQLVNDGGYYRKVDYQTVSVSGSSPTSNRYTLNFTANENVLLKKGKLLEFKFRVLDNVSKGVYKIYQMDGEDSLTCNNITDTASSNFTCAESYYTELRYSVEGSSNSLLSDLKIDGTTVKKFNKNTKEYNIETEKSQINIEAIKEDTNASISGDTGTKTLKYGVNSFNIIVTSEAGSKSTYTLYVTRLDKRSKINTLQSLEITDVNIKFSPDVLEYDCPVTNDIKKVTIKASLTDAKSTMEEDYSNKTIDLLEGINKVSIKVIAENGDEKTYVVNIIRELSSNNTLKELAVNEKKITVKEKVFDYSYEVASDVETATVTAVPNDSNSMIKIEQTKYLEYGDNQVKIIVTAPNGSEVAYHLNIIRKKKLSNNSSLSTLEVRDYQLNFKEDKYYYDLKIKDEDTLSINAIPADVLSTVNIEGNNNLINGSIIKISVKAEDGTVTRYFINIEKNVRSALPLFLVITFLCMAIIAVIIVFASKKKKETKIIDDAFEEKTWEPLAKNLDETSLEDTDENIKETSSEEKNEEEEKVEKKLDDNEN